MVTKEDVIKVLKKVYDPEIPINVYDLGLIYNIKVENDVVYIDMTMTSPACPLTFFVVSMVKSAVKGIKGVKDVKVRLVWDPPWSPERATEEGKKKLKELYPWLFEKR